MTLPSLRVSAALLCLGLPGSLLLSGCQTTGQAPALADGQQAATRSQPLSPAIARHLAPFDAGFAEPVGLEPATTVGGDAAPMGGGMGTGFDPDSLDSLSLEALLGTGTIVGDRVTEIHSEVMALDSSIDQQAADLNSLRARTKAASARYFERVAAINARLQAGTTPGNPRLIEQLNEAQRQLEDLSRDVSEITLLGTDIATAANLAVFLHDSIRASLSLSGAVEEDHEALARLADTVERLQVQIDRQLTIVQDEVARQSAYVAAEQRNLQTLALAIARGGRFDMPADTLTAAGVALGPAAGEPATGISPLASSANPGTRIMTIRLDREDVSYERALFQAVNRTLERTPQARFEVVAVTPGGGGASDRARAAAQAQQQAETILRAIGDMGVPSTRLSLSATADRGATVAEVQVVAR